MCSNSAITRTAKASVFNSTHLELEIGKIRCFCRLLSVLDHSFRAIQWIRVSCEHEGFTPDGIPWGFRDPYFTFPIILQKIMVSQIKMYLFLVRRQKKILPFLGMNLTYKVSNTFSRVSLAHSLPSQWDFRSHLRRCRLIFHVCSVPQKKPLLGGRSRMGFLPVTSVHHQKLWEMWMVVKSPEVFFSWV